MYKIKRKYDIIFVQFLSDYSLNRRYLVYLYAEEKQNELISNRLKEMCGEYKDKRDIRCDLIESEDYYMVYEIFVPPLYDDIKEDLMYLASNSVGDKRYRYMEIKNNEVNA